jgi:hypothetical protein
MRRGLFQAAKVRAGRLFPNLFRRNPIEKKKDFLKVIIMWKPASEP